MTGYVEVTRGVFASHDYSEAARRLAATLANNPQSALSKDERARLRQIAKG